MGDCQNYGPFLGTLNISCRILVGIQQRTINLTTTHLGFGFYALGDWGFRVSGFRGLELGVSRQRGTLDTAQLFRYNCY